MSFELWIIKIGSYLIVALACYEAGYIKGNLDHLKRISKKIEAKRKNKTEVTDEKWKKNH